MFDVATWKKRAVLALVSVLSVAMVGVVLPAALSLEVGAAERPTCVSSETDPDGDGWGFENGVSCIVGPSTDSGPDAEAPIEPAPEATEPVTEQEDAPYIGDESDTSTEPQPDEALAKVIITGPAPGSAPPSCASDRTDPDGDGWGFELGRSCVVTDETLVTPDLSVVGRCSGQRIQGTPYGDYAQIVNRTQVVPDYDVNDRLREQLELLFNEFWAVEDPSQFSGSALARIRDANRRIAVALLGHDEAAMFADFRYGINGVGDWALRFTVYDRDPEAAERASGRSDPAEDLFFRTWNTAPECAQLDYLGIDPLAWETSDVFWEMFREARDARNELSRARRDRWLGLVVRLTLSFLGAKFIQPSWIGAIVGGAGGAVADVAITGGNSDDYGPEIVAGALGSLAFGQVVGGLDGLQLAVVRAVGLGAAVIVEYADLPTAALFRVVGGEIYPGMSLEDARPVAIEQLTPGIGEAAARDVVDAIVLASQTMNLELAALYVADPTIDIDAEAARIAERIAEDVPNVLSSDTRVALAVLIREAIAEAEENPGAMWDAVSRTIPQVLADFLDTDSLRQIVSETRRFYDEGYRGVDLGTVVLVELNRTWNMGWVPQQTPPLPSNAPREPDGP